MGQYYIAVNTENMEHVEPHMYDNGAKLMEHSWIGNNFVEAVEFLLLEGARWHKKPIVWAGDYADPEEGASANLYNIVEGQGLQMLIEAIPPDYIYLVNYDKKEYVDKTKCPSALYNWTKEPFTVNPLPLLTAEGNGRGGGDYGGANEELVGTWSRCRLGLLNHIPEGFTEILPNFAE